MATLPLASSPHRSCIRAVCTCLVLFLLASVSAHATTSYYIGTFPNDSQQNPGVFTLTTTSTVTIETESYGGGTLGSTVVPGGGFVPELTLFGPTGNTITSDGGDGVCQAGMNVSASTGICDDALISQTLAPGSYLFYLTQFGEYAVGNNISQGFTNVDGGVTNFTAAVCGTSGSFYEIDLPSCPERTSSYAVTVNTNAVTSTTAVTPEPASVTLLAMPLFGLAYLGWRRSQLSV